MGRALMIPGMVGKNIQEWMAKGDLPKSVSKFGTKPEEIFVAYEELKAKYGNDFKDIPLGAVAIYTYGQKFKTGLQQLMAGCQKLPALHHLPRRPHGPHRGGSLRLRHSLRDGSPPRGS